VTVKVGAKSDVGRVREANEDAYLVKAPLFVVADGMGGHVAGDVASSLAVKVIASEANNASASDPDTLARLVRNANSAIFDRAQSDPSLRGMGTTCTLVLLDESRAHIAHVGDSRAYRLRNDTLEQLTEDHTLVGRMVREGKLRPEEATHHPQRSIITRVLGVDSDVQVDLQEIELELGDRLLLCSDGLSSMIEFDSIHRALSETDDPQSAADRLVALAIEAGGEDNVTVLVLDIVDGGNATAAASGGAAASTAGAARVGMDTDPGSGAMNPHHSLGSRTITTDDPDISRALSRADIAGESEARSDTDRAPEGKPNRPRRWPKRLGALIVVLLLIGGGVAAGRWFLSNSWFIGVGGSDQITIYQGIPEEIGGLDLSSVEETTTLELSDLPENRRSELQAGIKVTSLGEAQDRLSNLRSLARELQRQQEPNRRNQKADN